MRRQAGEVRVEIHLCPAPALTDQLVASWYALMPIGHCGLPSSVSDIPETPSGGMAARPPVGGAAVLVSGGGDSGGDGEQAVATSSVTQSNTAVRTGLPTTDPG